MVEPLPAPRPAELPWVLEAILFVAEEPQSFAALAQATGAGEASVRKALRQLAQDYEARGLRVMDDGRRVQLVTHEGYAGYIDQFLGQAPGQRLSRAALEVLTIVAYRQPCSRGEVEAIRGVNSDKLVTTLEVRGLLEEAGTADTPGRAKLYRTTMKFLEYFGIASPSELPPLPAEPGLETVDAF
ncbi:MAG: SMC-Scp complex subunit ScpB [Dehalococcoidia bacterium]